MVGGDKFDICLSTPLLFEYEDVLACEVLSISKSAADDILNYLCQIAVAQEIYYLWHPCLPNPKDDLVLELAVASQGPQILTCNVKNFASSERFNVRAVRPSEFLTEFGEKS
jgi:predicted nucleic acid-binding protein